jgi:hypothetical protein
MKQTRNYLLLTAGGLILAFLTATAFGEVNVSMEVERAFVAAPQGEALDDHQSVVVVFLGVFGECGYTPMLEEIQLGTPDPNKAFLLVFQGSKLSPTDLGHFDSGTEENVFFSQIEMRRNSAKPGTIAIKTGDGVTLLGVGIGALKDAASS